MNDYSLCPGKVLNAFLKSQGIKKKDMAARLGISAKCISEIINDKAPVTVNMALRLEDHTPYDAEYWMKIETCHRIHLARISETK